MAQDKQEGDLIVYPNPLDGGLFYLNLTNNCVRRSLYDANGRLVEDKQYNEFDKRDIVINVIGKPAGLYILRVITSEGKITTKGLLVK